MSKRLLIITACVAALAAAWALWTYVYTPWALRREYPLKYESEIRAASAPYELDDMLVFSVVWAESGFRPAVVSHVGAVGLMQIMPETGEWVAGKLGIAYDEAMLTDPEYNLSIGCWYMDYLLKRFDGDVTKAAAGYHAGGGNVDKWLENPEYSSDGVTLEHIPFNETRNYVTKVLRTHEIYTQLYGDQ